MINGLDLFSGIGGITLALSEWVRPIAYCEIDRYVQGVLLSRIGDGHLPAAPIWDDIRTLRGEDLSEPVDIVYGGFPCQDLSAAGAGRGLAGERSGLYFELERIVRETKPAFVFLENVPAIRTRGLGRVVWGLSELGYDCRWTIVSAAEVGAPHLRKRWFLLAHAGRERTGIEQGRGRRTSRQRTPKSLDHGAPESLANTDSERLEHSSEMHTGSECFSRWNPASGRGWWLTEPDVGRVVNELPHRMDRVKCLGNGVVPLQAREAFRRLMGVGA